ncbi:hypothetical protein FA15DRAFT_742050 [Coprinopsis marcescibilis]|uniref:Nephrocystin 3-like N-terminal domain-containing protein n=1 Tax=Coprinopsis marcescibilis TaxID=230819 RepID=A0A5C3KUC2_COPMA|nr:hypothetical protein FA15DRAFT_742050 [Coprinopsis marcescibilis]
MASGSVGGSIGISQESRWRSNREGASVLSDASNVQLSNVTLHAVRRDSITNVTVTTRDPMGILEAHFAVEATRESKLSTYAPQCKEEHEMTTIVGAALIAELVLLKLLWLSGPAGGGKSCIQQEMVDQCVENGTLAACYFFSTRVNGLDNADPFVAMISSQFCESIPGFKRELAKELPKDTSIFKKPIEHQFERLIHVPLRRAGTRWNMTYRIRLEDYNCNTDVEDYLIDSIFSICVTHPSKDKVPLNWSSREDVASVVEKASGQFIYASTFIKFISNPC